DTNLLQALAEATGGQLISEQSQQNSVLANRVTTTRPKEIWQALLILAAALWPIDVGIRRLHLTREQLEYAAARLRSFVARRPATELAAANPALGKLKTARARLRLSDKLAEQSSTQSSRPSTEAVPYASSGVEATETGNASSSRA